MVRFEETSSAGGGTGLGGEQCLRTALAGAELEEVV